MKQKINEQASSVESAEASQIPVTITSNVIDRWEGLSQTFEVWGDVPSSRYVSKILANDDDRTRVANFFVAREFASIFKSLIKTTSIKPVDCLLTKTDVYAALNAKLSVDQAGVVMELILPTMIELGMVSGNMRYSKHVRYGFDAVHTDAIRNEVAIYQVLQAVKATKATGIDKNIKYSVSVLSELLSENFRKIGLEMYEINDLAVIVGDMIKGVRANIDRTLSNGVLSGSVSSDWRNSRVVDELSKNLVFVKAAMALPPRSSVNLTSEGWKLEKWGPIILAALQSSERYAWVSKAEGLRTYGLRKIRDVKGRVKAALVFRSAKVQPVAQAVFSLEDSLMPGSYNINATKDRVAEVVQAAYGTATFDTAIGADLLHSILTDAIEAGWTHDRSVSELHLGVDETDLCCMVADRLYVELPNPADYVILDKDTSTYEYVPKWWYVVETSEKDLDVFSGVHRGTEVYTDDRDTVLMASNEFEPLDSVVPKPQLLGPAAFNTRVVAFDDRVLKSVKSRFTFDITINGVSMRGSFRPENFASMRTGNMTSLVMPHYNEMVINSLRFSFEKAKSLIERMTTSTPESWMAKKPGEEFFSLMRRRVARVLLSLSQQLSPNFRKDVNSAIIDRSISSVQDISMGDAELMRAKLMQRAYAASADVLAMQFFFFIQGIPEDDWVEMSNTEEMIKTYLEVGSDR